MTGNVHSKKTTVRTLLCLVFISVLLTTDSFFVIASAYGRGGGFLMHPEDTRGARVEAWMGDKVEFTYESEFLVECAVFFVGVNGDQVIPDGTDFSELSTLYHDYGVGDTVEFEITASGEYRILFRNLSNVSQYIEWNWEAESPMENLYYSFINVLPLLLILSFVFCCGIVRYIRIRKRNSQPESVDSILLEH